MLKPKTTDYTKTVCYAMCFLFKITYEENVQKTDPEMTWLKTVSHRSAYSHDVICNKMKKKKKLLNFWRLFQDVSFKCSSFLTWSIHHADLMAECQCVTHGTSFLAFYLYTTELNL